MLIVHSLDPIYDSDSRVLVLGTMPSIKSRELGFYYSHPKNRFWDVLNNVYNENVEDTKDSRINFLLSHKIALFDVLKSCDISSSSDNSIKNPVPNDFSEILKKANIDVVFTTGRKAYELYMKYCYPKTGIEAIYLPSTSPANCSVSFEELVKEYSKIKEYTDK